MTNQEIQEQAEKMYPIPDRTGQDIYNQSDLRETMQDAFKAGAKWAQENKCRHRLVSANNDIIQDGFFCVDCGELFGEYKRYVTQSKD